MSRTTPTSWPFEAARRFRSLAAVVNYMALDRPDLQFAASVLGRYMSRPTLKAQAAPQESGEILTREPDCRVRLPEGPRVRSCGVGRLVGQRLGGRPCHQTEHYGGNVGAGWRYDQVLVEQTGLHCTFLDAAGGSIWPGIAPPHQGSPRERAKDIFGGIYKGADHQKGKSKGNSKGVGEGSEGKGKGRGYQETCWKCGIVGHKALECSNPGQYPYYQRQANNIEDGGTEDIDVGCIWIIGNIDAEDWVEVPPGLGKRWTRSARTTWTGTNVSNRYELPADHADDGQWDMTHVGNSDDEERVNVVAGRECGTQCATSKKADWKLHRKVGVEVGAVETRIARVKSRERGMRPNVARAQKPLASAAEVVEAGNKISMGLAPDDNYIMNDTTGEKIALRIDRGTFVFDMEFQDGEVGTITLDSGAGVNVWPENVQSHVPMMAKDPRLRMTVGNGTNIDNLGTKIIKFHGVQPGFTRQA